MHKNNKPIKIGILEVSAQNKAILEFFFNGAGKTSFKETSLDESSAFIIDYDFPGAKESWENIYQTTKKPGIIISIREVELPDTIWIAKPLTTKDLIDAGLKIGEMSLQQEKQVAVSAPVLQSREIEEKEESLSTNKNVSEISIAEESLLEARKNTKEEKVFETAEPELAFAETSIETTIETSSTQDSTQSPVNFNDHDFSLDSPLLEETDKPVEQAKKKSQNNNENTSIEPKAETELAEDNTDIDSLLASLISGGKNSQTEELVEKITTDYIEDNKPEHDESVTPAITEENNNEIKAKTDKAIDDSANNSDEVDKSNLDLLNFDFNTADFKNRL